MEDSTTPISTVGIIGLGSVGLPLATTFAGARLRVIATAHTAIDLAAVVEHADLVVDLRNAVRQRLGGVAGAVPANVDVL